MKKIATLISCLIVAGTFQIAHADEMGKDGMKKDGMTKDAMAKDGM